jgi:hypothetical protein
MTKGLRRAEGACAAAAQQWQGAGGFLVFDRVGWLGWGDRFRYMDRTG